MEINKRIVPKELWELNGDELDYLYNDHETKFTYNGKEEVLNGLSIGQIADMYNASKSNVTYRLRKFNIRKKTMFKEQYDLFMKMFLMLRRYMSSEDIRKELGIDFEGGINNGEV